MGVACLHIRSGAVRGAERLVFHDELVVGRASLADALGHDEQLSRRHARFFVDSDGHVRVEDLGSANGTFVNGALIDATRMLKLGDEIRLGATTFELVVASAETGGEWQRPHASAQAAREQSLPPAPARPAVPAPARPGTPSQPPASSPSAPSEPKAAPAAPATSAERPKRPPRSGLLERVRAQRAVRTQLPPFPNATQVPSLLPVRGWWIVRAAGLLATLTVVVLLFAAPSTGLRIMWGIGIPLLPIMFFVAPGLWRNICPLAASNQLPRVLGFTRAGTPPAWLNRYAYGISIALLVAFVGLRKVGLQTSGGLSGLLLLGALGSAFIGGFLAKGKSGWCSAICPLLPVQRIYGQTPFALVANSHCQPCVGCTKNCYDFNPRVAYLADLNEKDEGWSASRKLFVAAFPGLVLGFFEVGNVPDVSAPVVFGQLALYMSVGVMAFFLLDAFLGVSVHRLTTIYAAVALNVFYWFAFPDVFMTISGAHAPDAVTWGARVALAALTGYWVLRTYVKERAFAQRAGPPQVPGESAKRSLAIHSGVQRFKPEVTFMPDEKRIVAEPGQTVLELAEANSLPIEVGCRMGLCGADPIAILDGMDYLAPVSDDERATLERLGLADNTRMACCCRIKGPITVSLKPEQAAKPRPSRVMALPFDRSVERVVVIGNGIAGMTAAEYVRRNHPLCAIDVVAEETHHLYNRMAITRLIYGRSAMQGLFLNPESWCEARETTLWLNTRARSIDREAGEVLLGTGETLAFDRLILATGSSSVIPPIEGWGAPGSFVLRSANDALELRAFAQLHGARDAVVAGGGLLGLEAAYATHNAGLATTILERSDRLLRRQLDARASELLRRYMEGLGIAVRTGAETAAVSGNGRMREVLLKDTSRMPAEVLVMAAGIAPNVDLARAAGLDVKRGVIVDDHMHTSGERIFAAGDVAEFQGQIYGLWPAAVEQARVAAETAVGEASKPYAGTIPVTVLKVAGIELTSIGRFEPDSPDDEVIVQEDESTLRYGKLVLSGGRVVGAILLGYSREISPVTSAVKQGWNVEPVIEDLRAGRWDALERLGRGRPLSAVSAVGLGTS